MLLFQGSTVERKNLKENELNLANNNLADSNYTFEKATRVSHRRKHAAEIKLQLLRKVLLNVLFQMSHII